MERAIVIAFQNDDLELEEIKQIPSDINMKKDKVMKILIEGELKGYAYLGFAPSKERDFDFLIMFNKEDLSIKQSKVLIYRESFGREIGSQRWLDQFNGMTPSSQAAKFGKDIDGISGATISARSMTLAVNNALKNMGLLQNSDLL